MRHFGEESRNKFVRAWSKADNIIVIGTVGGLAILTSGIRALVGRQGDGSKKLDMWWEILMVAREKKVLWCLLVSKVFLADEGQAAYPVDWTESVEESFFPVRRPWFGFNLANVEGLRARSSLKPGASGIGGGGGFGGLDSSDDDDGLVFRRWRRRLLSRLRTFSFTWGFALRVVLFLAAAAAFYSGFSSLSVEKKLKDLLLWIKEDLGPWGPLALILVYIPLTILAVPASVLTLGGGYLFGLPVGFIADTFGATLGATAAFLVGRTVGRPYIISKLKNYPKFQAVNIAVERSGFKIVLLLRLVPLLPFNVLNYLLSVTPVHVGDFMLASMLGVMPITFALVYVGTTLKDLSAITHGWHEASKLRWVFMLMGFAVSGALFYMIIRIAKASLEKALAENGGLEATAMLPLVTDTATTSSLPLVITIDPAGGR